MKKLLLFSLLGCCSVIWALPETAVTILSFDTTDGSGGNSASAIAGLSYDARDYELQISSAQGTPVPAVGTHAFAWRSTVTCQVDRVVQNGSYFLNDGWSVDLGVSGNGNKIVLTLNTVDTSLSWLWRTIAIGDIDNDGFDDVWEAQNGLIPGVDESGITSYIQNNDSTFGLYSSSALLDLDVGDLGLSTSNGNANLSLQVEQSDDLQSWTNAGDTVEWSLPVSADKKFFRVRANP